MTGSLSRMAVVGRALGKIFPNNQGSAKLTGFRFQRNLKSKKCAHHLSPTEVRSLDVLARLVADLIDRSLGEKERELPLSQEKKLKAKAEVNF